METHSPDPTSLVAGLFFGLAGLAIFAHQQWDDVDVTAFTAAGVMVIGLLLAGLVISRYLRADLEPDNQPKHPHAENPQPEPSSET
jgi:predicted transporter